MSNQPNEQSLCENCGHGEWKHYNPRDKYQRACGVQRLSLLDETSEPLPCPCPSFRPAEKVEMVFIKCPECQQEASVTDGKYEIAHDKHCSKVKKYAEPRAESNCFICRKPIESGQTASSIHTGCHAICPHNPCSDCISQILARYRDKIVEMVEKELDAWDARPEMDERQAITLFVNNLLHLIKQLPLE